MPAREKYSFNSVQTHFNQRNGHVEEVTEAVSVRNGKGTKSVRIRTNNKVKTAKRKLNAEELKNIKSKTFMPNLFQACHGDCNKAAAQTASLTRNKKTQKKKPTKK